ncbi:MAG: protein kinase, partial [Acidimicrobiia bacterium]|nr:protein kinase [Acidimicrobiia bacterium]
MSVDSVDLGVAHLEPQETIGRGGFSVVYKALDTKLNRYVAVKVLTAAVDRADLDRFDQECQIHGPLSNHPNIVTIHDAGYTRTGSPFLVMEYLDGGSLTDHLEANGPMQWQQAVDWMAPICDAVDTAHRMGVLHRDIKPANILISPDGPKLADFGIACVSDATSPQFAVSWHHAPPEAELNRRDERSDVYSLASTTFQLLTGHAPFWRPGEDSLAGLLHRMVSEPAPRLSPAVAPRWLDDLLQRALDKDPGRRPASAAELRDLLLAGPSADPGAAPTVRHLPIVAAVDATAVQPGVVPPPHEPASLAPVATPGPSIGSGPLAHVSTNTGSIGSGPLAHVSTNTGSIGSGPL